MGKPAAVVIKQVNKQLPMVLRGVKDLRKHTQVLEKLLGGAVDARQAVNLVKLMDKGRDYFSMRG